MVEVLCVTWKESSSERVSTDSDYDFRQCKAIKLPPPLLLVTPGLTTGPLMLKLLVVIASSTPFPLSGIIDEAWCQNRPNGAVSSKHSSVPVYLEKEFGSRDSSFTISFLPFALSIDFLDLNPTNKSIPGYQHICVRSNISPNHFQLRQRKKSVLTELNDPRFFLVEFEKRQFSWRNYNIYIYCRYSSLSPLFLFFSFCGVQANASVTVKQLYEITITTKLHTLYLDYTRWPRRSSDKSFFFKLPSSFSLVCL